jgi:hypothetical protein
MRSTIPATLLALGCCFIYSFHSTGCATNTLPPASTGGSGGSGGDGGSGGSEGGAAGAGGGPVCTPVDETCDGKDNDCDGQVDEDCPCIDGQTQSCYSGPDGTQGVGPCSSGQQTCDATGTWGPCEGEVKPKNKELCNLVDDDCNGSADDMGETTCGVGACQVTVVTCDAGKLSACVPLAATLEICDGLDNNCNQLVDETFPNNDKVCAVAGQSGPCVSGKTKCMAGGEICVPDVMPTVEVCNDIDDDCDGTVDNNISGTGFDCGTGYLGVCAQGQLQCKGGKVDCFPIVPSSGEKCNGLDDDCDGTVDENNPGGNIVCDTGKPNTCSAGTTQCTNGVLSCTPNFSNEPEQCNGIDDDCDDAVDEGNPGGGVACGCNGIRSCIAGKLVCQGGPAVYLEEDFSNASGWTLDPEWDIKAPPAMVTCGDPTTDTSPTMDNVIAGVNVGGCASASLHSYYYLTSPAFDTTNAPAVLLSFQRWLRTDYTPYMNSVVQVFNGAAWYTIWQNGAASVTDAAWNKVTYDISNYKNANMRIRWGFNVGSQGSAARGSWNIDDVQVIAGVCP